MDLLHTQPPGLLMLWFHHESSGNMSAKSMFMFRKIGFRCRCQNCQMQVSTVEPVGNQKRAPARCGKKGNRRPPNPMHHSAIVNFVTPHPRRDSLFQPSKKHVASLTC